MLVDELFQNLLNGLRILWVMDESLMQDSESIEKSLIVISFLLFLEIVSNILHVLFKMLAIELGVAALAIFQGADLLYKDSHLMLVVELMIVIILESHILDWIILKFTKLALAHLEHRERYLRKNVIDVWLDHVTGYFESQT